MKSCLIVFICVLSICQAGVIITPKPEVKSKASDVVINNSTQTIPPVTDISPTVTSTKETPTKPSTITVSIPPQPSPTTRPSSSSTSTTSKPSSTTTTVTPSPSTTTVTPSPPPSTTHKPDPPTTTTIKPTVAPTVSSSTAKPTSEPIVSTTPASAPSNRGFDGPSFIGGIVLASGLMAIGFVALKFYRARTELNYHTL